MSKFGLYMTIRYLVASDIVFTKRFNHLDGDGFKAHQLPAHKLPVLLFQLVDAGYTVKKTEPGLIAAFSDDWFKLQRERLGEPDI